MRLFFLFLFLFLFITPLTSPFLVTAVVPLITAATFTVASARYERHIRPLTRRCLNFTSFMLPYKLTSRNLRTIRQSTYCRNLPNLTKGRLIAILSSEVLSRADRRDLALILLGRKFITELSSESTSEKALLLETLGLCWVARSMVREGKKRRWLQVAANEAILSFVTKYGHNMSPLEAGILYGIPPTATLAYMNLIEPNFTKGRRLAGCASGYVHSDLFWREEQTKTLEDRRLLAKLSPLFIESQAQATVPIKEPQKRPKESKGGQ
jgi:hypothetical protein